MCWFRQKNKEITNREKFKQVFGVDIEEYNGWNNEFVIINKHGAKLSANWLDKNFVPKKG